MLFSYSDNTIAGTIDNCFNNFRHFVKCLNFSILLLLLLFLFGQATVKLKHNVSVNTTDGSLKYQYPVQWAFKSAIFLWANRVWMKIASFHEAIKVGLMPTIKTAFLIIALCQNLPRPSFKSNVNNISHCQACFLKLKFPWLKIF